MNRGDEVTYFYRPPKGMGVVAHHFKAEVVGFTPKGRIKIKAFDHINNEHFTATVMSGSLELPKEKFNYE